MASDSATPASRPLARVRDPVKYSVALVLLAVAYFSTGTLGLLLGGIHPSVTAIWPPAPIAISALALFGYRLWPGIGAGAFLINLSRTGHLESSLLIAAGNTSAALLGAWFLRRYGVARAFDRPGSLAAFLGGSGFLASFLSASVGATTLAWTGLLESGTAPRIWFTWLVGDAVTIWLLVPLLLLGHDAWISRRKRRIRIPPARKVEFLAALLALLATSLLSFGGMLPEPYNTLSTGFLSLPFMFWLSMRFGSLGVSVGLIGYFIIAVLGTRLGHGIYAGAPDRYILLQLYLAVRVFFFHLLAVVVSLSRRVIDDLRASRQRMQELIQSLPGVVWESWGNPASEDYKVAYVSDQSEQMVGFTPQEWISRPDFLWGRIHPEDMERVKREAADIFAGKGSGVSQFRILAKDGKPVDVEMRMTVMRDLQGAPVGMRGFNLDITDRVKSERLLQEVENQLKEAQKMEAVGRLAGGVAHDYNNLLTTIIGYSDLISNAAPKEGPIRAYAGEIRSASARAADLTRQLLTFSRQDVVQPTLIDVNGLVSTQERLMVSLLGENIRLGLNLDPGPHRVKVDPHHLERILFNLIRNARDAMPRGGVVKVETSWHKESAGDGFYLEPSPGHHVVLSVIDTGTGIPRDALPHIFEPFYTTKGGNEAVGLGLPTVYGIVRRYGGGIRVTSALGAGTRFDILLPANVAEPVPAGVGREGGTPLENDG